MKFVKGLSDFTDSDKLTMLKSFHLVSLRAGQRIQPDSDKLDSFNIVLKGKIGVFGINHDQYKAAK